MLDESVEILRQAWSGAPIDFVGKPCQVTDVTITPQPARPPKIFMGANTDAAVDRAARLADGFLPVEASLESDISQYLDLIERYRGDARAVACSLASPARRPRRPRADLGRDR